MGLQSRVNRRSVLQTIGSIGVGGGILSSSAAASPQTTSDVSKKEARKIARKAVDHIGDQSEFEDWRAQRVERPQLFYAKVQDGNDVRYEPRAWLFPIERRGDDIGYIAIDARQTESPVLSYGRSTAPQREYVRAEQLARATGRSVQDRFIYHGGTEFGVETVDRKVVDLRGKYIKDRPAVKTVKDLLPTTSRVPKHGNARRERNPYQSSTDGSSSINSISYGKEGDDEAPDWEGSTDYEVYGVPNWTRSDAGGASSTNFGSGPDSWSQWDGCAPIAGSMVIGYYEGVSESQVDAREELIDRLHVAMKTDYDGNSKSYNIPAGIEGYSQGRYEYGANNDRLGIESTVRSYIRNGRPLLLSMNGGPYGDSFRVGHSVTVVGYKHESVDWWLDDHYYKVHNGYGESPDRIVHGNWDVGFITKIWKK